MATEIVADRFRLGAATPPNVCGLTCARPIFKGWPEWRYKGFTLPVRDILVYKGAGFIVPVAGGIKLMPGTASDPAYRRIDVDVKTGKVKGLF